MDQQDAHAGRRDDLLLWQQVRGGIMVSPDDLEPAQMQRRKTDIAKVDIQIQSGAGTDDLLTSFPLAMSIAHQQDLHVQKGCAFAQPANGSRCR